MRLVLRRAPTLAFAASMAWALCPVSATAQSGAGSATFHIGGMDGSSGSQTSANALVKGPPNSCPAGLRAQHLADGQMLQADRGHSRGFGQRLHLTLDRPDARNIVSITVSVTGWTPHGALQPAAQDKKAAAAHAQTRLIVPMQATSDSAASGDLWAPGLTAVESVDLVSIAYTDGSSWTPASGQSCRISPDGFMLIGAR